MTRLMEVLSEHPVADALVAALAVIGALAVAWVRRKVRW